MLSGENKGQEINARQINDGFIAVNPKEVEKGDKVIIHTNQITDDTVKWIFSEYVRTDALIILALVFMLFLIIFGRKKGLNTILSLVFTCYAIFGVFVPAILSGHNIYLWTGVISAFVIIMTILIINPPDIKTLSSIIGCFGGIISIALMMSVMDFFINLSGVIDEDSTLLLNINPLNPINLKAIIFAAIIIGALGAVMDVAMSIASALNEIIETSESPDFNSIFKSGMNIGKDVMGTMSNTLILAYIGSSLSVVLLLVAYNYSFLALMNREMIVVEILQALIGSIGILFTIPLTSFVCAVLYKKQSSKIIKEQVLK